jgi:hypothetical protein
MVEDAALFHPTALLQIVLVRQQIVVGRGAGYRVFFFGPGTQVDLLAALATERPVFVGLAPLDFLAAGGAVYNWHG